MIEVTGQISIRESELKFEFVRSGGPGGQKVNKTSSAVLLQFDVRNCPSIPGEVKERLLSIAGKSLNSEGILQISSRKYRSQIRNRENAIHKLVKIIRKAAKKQNVRKATKPTVSSKQKRLNQKKKRSMVKENRNYTPSKEDFI